MRVVIFQVACVKRVRNSDTTQLKQQLRKYQDVGRVLSLRSLSIRWFSRHAVVLATQGGTLFIASDLHIKKRNIDECTEYGLLEVEVPIIFLGTAGFSAHREGRYVRKLSIWMICSDSNSGVFGND